MRSYITKFVIPGVLCIGLAFLAGSQKNYWIGLFGFLPFFVIGVALIIEGYRKMKKKSDS